MEALDGNAIAGLLSTIFGAEMTTSIGRCGACGAARQAAELTIYLHAPGVVARCPACDAVLLVIVDVRGKLCVNFHALRSLEIQHS